MIYLFIGAYAALGILVFIMFKALKNSVNKIDEQSKTYYIDKLQEYDDLINNKEKKLNELNEKIKNKKVEAENIKNLTLDDKEEFDMSIIDSLSRANYKDKSLFEFEKLVNEKWEYDNKKILTIFLEKTENSKSNFEFCKNLKSKFNKRNVYELKILTDKKLEEQLKNILTEKEYSFLGAYKKTHEKFVIDEFILYLNELVELNNPEIIVYVGNKSENYDYLSTNVKTKYDETIYKGMKILYQGKIYDFSLNGRNL